MADDKKENIFTPKKNVRFFFVSFIGLAIACMLIWPPLDMLFDSISGDTYSWSVWGGIGVPIIFSLILTSIEFIFWNFFHPNKK